MIAKAGTRKRKWLVTAIICAALTLAAAVLIIPTRGILSAHYGMTTTAGRQAYLRDLGWEIDPGSEACSETTLPETFDAVLESYNALQLQQGFDLTPYLGNPITVVTYSLADQPDTVVTLWICDGVVIAGDVHTTALDGRMQGIVKE